jgi:hypothetical protein
MLIKQLPVPCDYSTQNRIQLSEKCFAIVDPEDLPWLSHYDWRCVKSHSRFYAARREVRGGHYHYIRMHRQLMNTPFGMEVHHVNGNTLDNRKMNLSNIDPALHAQLRVRT